MCQYVAANNYIRYAIRPTVISSWIPHLLISRDGIPVAVVVTGALLASEVGICRRVMGHADGADGDDLGGRGAAETLQEEWSIRDLIAFRMSAVPYDVSRNSQIVFTSN